jgi:hypothetical protein
MIIDKVVRNPKLVIEILSKSMQHIDRREKALMYQRVEAIEEYVLMAQNQPRVIVHRSVEDWRPGLYAAMAAQVEFRSEGCGCLGRSAMRTPGDRWLDIRSETARCFVATCGPAAGER